MATAFAVWSLALVGASCDKKTAEGPTTSAAPVGTSPGVAPAEDVPGVDVSKLSGEQKQRFFQLVDKLQSPCGKAHSLRTSVKTDASCKRATFAARYVARLAGEDLTLGEITEKYEARYLASKTYRFDLADTPYSGNPDAPVQIVEFFDYGCPHCKLFAPMLEEILAEFPRDVVVYYKHFPLSSHMAESVPAAIAATAAFKQGKFLEMHKKLFAAQEAHAHAPEDLFRYAAEIGLDLKKFGADFADPALRDKVMKDRAEGEKADLVGTPTVYINGRMFTDDLGVDTLAEWIREELAVNR